MEVESKHIFFKHKLEMLLNVVDKGRWHPWSLKVLGLKHRQKPLVKEML